MLSISALPQAKSGRAVHDYFAEGEYYLNGEAGVWKGSGAVIMGLEADVTRKTFLNLLDGHSADGALGLVHNAGKPDRQRGWDLTFSAPKSVSVAWAIGSREVKGTIERAHDRALEEALRLIEDKGGISRRGKGGMQQVPAALIFATFRHNLSRLNDPQLHTHAILLNVGVRRDGSTGALRTQQIYELKMEAGRFYRAALEKELQSAGFQTVSKDGHFDIQGISKAVCREFSRRRKEVEAELNGPGKAGAIAAKAAALKTRQNKVKVAPELLERDWKERANSYGLTEESIEKLRRNVHQNALFTPASRESTSAEEKKASGASASSKDGEAKGGKMPGETEEQKRRSDWRNSRTTRVVFTIRNEYRKWKTLLTPARPLPRWGKFVVKKDLGIIVVGVQRRNVFRKAPRWSPLREVSIPALRVAPSRSLAEILYSSAVAKSREYHELKDAAGRPGTHKDHEAGNAHSKSGSATKTSGKNANSKSSSATQSAASSQSKGHSH